MPSVYSMCDYSNQCRLDSKLPGFVTDICVRHFTGQTLQQQLAVPC